MNERADTALRALIAAIVIGITAYFTWDGTDVAQEWQAVFIMVVAYYFKERPQVDRLRVIQYGRFRCQTRRFSKLRRNSR